MRIRKNTKLSSFYGGDRHETYVCNLNQSPWDVIPVTYSGDEYSSAAELTNLIDSSWFLPSPSPPPPPSSYSSPPLNIHQYNGEDSFNNGNMSLGDSSNGASERSLHDYRSRVSAERLNLIAAEEYERSPEDPMILSKNNDRKSRAVESNSPVKSSGDVDQVDVGMPVKPKRGRPRGSGKKAKALSTAAAPTNPYEFYYYSGFGPRWGRRRNGSGGDDKIVMSDEKTTAFNEEVDETAAFNDESRSFDYEEEEEKYDVIDEEDSDNVKMNKRGRKPLKERSLKSLM
ncbi:unnamed protein product [Cochlearia groenlandica]